MKKKFIPFKVVNEVISKIKNYILWIKSIVDDEIDNYNHSKKPDNYELVIPIVTTALSLVLSTLAFYIDVFSNLTFERVIGLYINVLLVLFSITFALLYSYKCKMYKSRMKIESKIILVITSVLLSTAMSPILFAFYIVSRDGKITEGLKKIGIVAGAYLLGTIVFFVIGSTFALFYSKLEFLSLGSLTILITMLSISGIISIWSKVQYYDEANSDARKDIRRIYNVSVIGFLALVAIVLAIFEPSIVIKHSPLPDDYDIFGVLSIGFGAYLGIEQFFDVLKNK